MTPANKTKVKRVPKRGHYDLKTIYRILDTDFICHVAFQHQSIPVVIPTIYARKDNKLYFHGASVSRMLVTLEQEIPVSVAVTNVGGIVLARSAFHHSLNYESVVIFGQAKLVIDEEEKWDALKEVSDQVLKGRWEEVRLPNAKEMKATKVLSLVIEEASAKIRTGPPVDDKQDYELDIWAGVVPIKKVFGTPESDPMLKEGVDFPSSVKRFLP